MNRVWVLWALVLGCSREPAVPVPPEGPVAARRILAFGDSLTAGKDLPEDQAYPAVLERTLKARGHSVSVINAGHSGDTTFDGLARLDFSLADRPHVVIVALGSNDTFQGKSLADIERNLAAILRRSRDAGAVTVLCGMKTFPNLGLTYALDYTKMFKRLASQEGAILVPFLLEGVAGDSAMNLPDLIHPNARGHERVAKTLLPYVENALKMSTP